MRIIKIAVLVVLAIGFGGLVLLTPPETWLAQSERLRVYIAEFGPWAPAVFFGLTSGLITVGFPRLPLCALGAMCFGFTLGTGLSLAGSLLGSYLMFLLVRRSGIDFGIHRNPKTRGYAERLAARGVLAVLLLRQLPVNGLYNNVLLGLSRVGHRDFWIGSTLGFLPTNLAASLAGAGVLSGDPVRATQYVIFAAVGLAASGLGFSALLRRLRRPAEIGADLSEAIQTNPTESRRP